MTVKLLRKLNLTLDTASFMRLSDGLNYKTNIFYEKAPY